MVIYYFIVSASLVELLNNARWLRNECAQVFGNLMKEIIYKQTSGMNLGPANLRGVFIKGIKNLFLVHRVK